ncbi:DUF4403 family protein [Flavobacterium aciduliphilum]|nr:DUF4403 family protein [Flavobacterium aciduliphilum]
MKKNLFFVFYIMIIALLTRCGTTSKIEALKPEPSGTNAVVYKTTNSYVNMPLEVSLNEIENQVNKSLHDLVYEDANLEDDKTQMKIWKTSSIKLAAKDGKIESVLPLKIWIKIKYGTEFLGLNDTKELDLNGIITVQSDIKLSNWKLTTNSVIKDFNWSESPTLLVAGKKMPVTYLINPALSLFKTKIAKKIDDAIEKTCDFKPYVLTVLQTLSNPFQTSAQYETWFKLNPLEITVTDAVLQKNTIKMDLGLKCTMQTIVGETPKNNFNKDNFLFKSVAKVPEKTTVSVAAVSTFESASRIITKNFQGKEFSSGSRKIVIQNVTLWSKDSKIIIALDLTGSINGTIYLSGIPNYNTVTKEIYFDQMDYVLNTKGLLTKTANWLLQGVILKKMEESCRYSIKENLEEGRKNLLPFLNNYSPMKGVFVNGSLDDFEFEKVEITSNALVAFIKTTGKMNVKIDGMD